MLHFVPNPTRPGQLRAVHITDRAKRYRAQAAAPPEKNPRCYLCGAPEPRDVEHIDGDEANTDPANLARACRSCNTTKGRTFARNGMGKRTRQYNPARRRKNAGKAAGAKTMAQYVKAVFVLKHGSDQMELQEAIDLIHNTPAADRSKFAREIYSRRRGRS